MPRPPRVQFAGAIYHLMNRGVRGEDLYTDAREHAHFLALLAKTCERYEWLVGTYCLMGNHYHLLVTTAEPTLSSGMQWLNSCYAQWFNWRHRYEGHAFFRRFHSVLIKSDSQLAEVARYILLNPVRAHLCNSAEDWPWSSYRAMIGKEPMPAFLNSDWLLEEFGVGMEQARVNFAAFICAAE
jgi:REP element-mobilizing transposase RayT